VRAHDSFLTVAVAVLTHRVILAGQYAMGGWVVSWADSSWIPGPPCRPSNPRDQVAGGQPRRDCRCRGDRHRDPRQLAADGAVQDRHPVRRHAPEYRGGPGGRPVRVD
jgi:hypothetical protein